MKAVIIESIIVANTFSAQDLLEKSPIIKSRVVLAMKGPLISPLRESNAGTINIKIRKLLKGRIKNERTIPARRAPIMEMISEGKISLMSLPLESCFSILNTLKNEHT